MTKPVVLHYSWIFLPISEVFVYRQIKYLKNFTSIVIARKEANRELFPWEPVYVHARKTTGYLFMLQDILGLDPFWNFCRSVIGEKGVQILHAHFGHLGYQMLRMKRAAGLPLVTSFYGIDVSAIAGNRRWQRKYRALFEEGDIFLAEGNHLKGRLMALGCPEEKIRIQHLGVELDKIPFKPRRPKGDGKACILFCGRFTEKKGLIDALKAVREAYRSFPDLEFRIVGDGELRREIESFISAQGMEDYVRLLGMQPHSVLREELDRADIFIHPSRTASNGETEGGAPTILLEAQASGLPVLSTLHCDIPEYVINGVSGLLVNEKDWKALSDRLIYLLKNQEKWEEMGRAGRRHIENHYDISKEILNLENVYRSFIPSEIVP